MSVADLRPDHIREYKRYPFHSPAVVVDGSALLQRAIQTISPDIRNQIILRCDQLPSLQSTEESLEKAFTQLLQLIVKGKGAASKLYLYITCSEDKAPDGVSLQLGLKTYLIQFHANIKPHAEWMREEEQRINQIVSLLLPFGGGFMINHLKNSDSVFCITLSGK